jgi:hypothetical protein
MELMAYILIGLAYASGMIVGVLICRQHINYETMKLIKEKRKQWFTEGYTTALLDTNLQPRKEKRKNENVSTERNGNIITINRHGYGGGFDK